MKIDKVLIYIGSFILLAVVLIAGYFLINNYVNPQQEKKIINIENKGEILNIDKEKKIENPTKEDVENLINKLKEENNQLNNK